MKLDTVTDFEGVVPGNSIQFKFSSNNAKLFSFLSDGIYRDKIMAVIREISCNAADAHVMAGVDAPFTVHVPSTMDPTFRVEDYGTGIPPEKIADIFWTYGDSTKTEDDRQIGALGLGSKSPFAYTKGTFVVKNRYAGREYIYMCHINARGTPDGALTSDEPTDMPNGVTVELAVRSSDIYAFQYRIEKFFSLWDKKPNFTGASISFQEIKKVIEGTDWYKVNDTSAIAVMGGVPYPIIVHSIPNPSKELQFVCANGFVINFPIGSLRFQISREELSYEEITVKALEAAAKVIASEIRDRIQAQIETEGVSPYELVVAFNKFQRNVGSQYQSMNLLSDKGLFDKAHVFKTSDGQAFTVEDLIKHHSGVTLTFPKRTPFSFHELIQYSSTNSFKLRGAVTLQKTSSTSSKLAAAIDAGDEDDETVAEHKEKQVVKWYSAGIVPRLSINGGNVCDYLHYGYVPVQTEVTIPITTQGTLEYKTGKPTTKIRILINNMGTNGLDAARLMGNGCSANGNKLFFLVNPDKGIQASDVMTAVQAAIKGTILEGVEIGFLNDAKDYKPVPSRAAPSAPVVQKPRGHMEVRVVKIDDKLYSSYEIIDPATFDGYYIRSADKQEMEYFRGLRSKLAALKDAGYFTFDNKPFIVRNDDDIALLKKRGAKLTWVRDIVPQAVLDKLEADYQDYLNQRAEIENITNSSYQLRNLTDKLVSMHSDGYDLKSARLQPLLEHHVQLQKALNAKNLHKMIHAATIWNINCLPTVESESLADHIQRMYPLLAILDNGTVSHRMGGKTLQAVVDYIMMMDAKAAFDAAVDAASEEIESTTAAE